MKKQILILQFTCTCFVSISQKNIVTDVPCTDVMTQHAIGRWIKSPERGTYDSKETNNWRDQIHDMFFKLYPQPTGVDAVWGGGAGVSYFGSKRKYYTTKDGRQAFDYSNLPHFVQFSYVALFFRYRCEYGKTHSLERGYPGETGTTINFTANAPTLGENVTGDDWTLNGLPVIMRKPPKKSLDGLEFTHFGGGSASGNVLVHRKGILPYKPVSRREYLDYCIIYWTRLWDETIKLTEQAPVRSLEEQENEKKAKLAKMEKDYAKYPKRLKSAVDYFLTSHKTDLEIRDERVYKDKKLKDQYLKKFTDELQKTTKEGLLDSPAMIRVKYHPEPIFVTDPAGGYLLVTENPEYIRKDLPKHMPQFIKVTWGCNDWGPQKRICEIMEKEFPFEKLQAMIDQ